MRRAAVFAAALLTPMLVTLVPAPSSAWCRMTTSPRQPTAEMPCVLPDPTTDPPEQFLEWRRPCTALALSSAALSSEMSEPDVLGVLDRSIAAWEAVTCEGTPVGVDIEIMEEQCQCREPLYDDDAGNVNAVMFVADWGEREYDPAAFAVTTVWHRRSTGEILDADMEVNEQRGPFGICPEGGCLDRRTVDLQNVVTHELGHYLGIAHTDILEATMYASAIAGETLKRSLEEDDAEGLCAIYPPGRPEGVCDYVPRGGLDLSGGSGCCSAFGPGHRSSGSLPLWLALTTALALFTRRRRGR